MSFQKIFVSEEPPYKGKSKRDKYLSRIFGIFNEEIIRIWCRNEKSPFEDLGRPTVYDSTGKGHTLDFLLKDKRGQIFVSEMKCEIEYQKYKYLTLTDPKQIARHTKKEAFQKFLTVAAAPEKIVVKCSGQEIQPDGAALVWGRVNDDVVTDLLAQFSLSHIISTERVVNDLKAWGDVEYLEMVNEYKVWSDQLFTYLSKRP